MPLKRLSARSRVISHGFFSELGSRMTNVPVQARAASCASPATGGLGRCELDSADIAELHMLLRLPKIVVVLHRKPAFGRTT